MVSERIRHDEEELPEQGLARNLKSKFSSIEEQNKSTTQYKPSGVASKVCNILNINSLYMYMYIPQLDFIIIIIIIMDTFIEVCIFTRVIIVYLFFNSSPPQHHSDQPLL